MEQQLHNKEKTHRIMPKCRHAVLSQGIISYGIKQQGSVMPDACPKKDFIHLIPDICS